VAGIERETSIAFGYAAESYVDFGIPVMFVPVLLFGVFCGAMYEVILRTLHHRELAVSLVTVVFWMSLYLFERSWPKTLGQSITMMVYLGGMCFLIDRWLLMRADKLPDETAVTRAGALADGQALR
jgi:ribose/xylose/arabinose/galactoside ABC-type transport system permease subunit